MSYTSSLVIVASQLGKMTMIERHASRGDGVVLIIAQHSRYFSSISELDNLAFKRRAHMNKASFEDHLQTSTLPTRLVGSINCRDDILTFLVAFHLVTPSYLKEARAAVVCVGPDWSGTYIDVAFQAFDDMLLRVLECLTALVLHTKMKFWTKLAGCLALMGTMQFGGTFGSTRWMMHLALSCTIALIVSFWLFNIAHMRDYEMDLDSCVVMRSKDDFMQKVVATAETMKALVFFTLLMVQFATVLNARALDLYWKDNMKEQSMTEALQTNLASNPVSSNKQKADCHIHKSPMKQDNTQGGAKRNEEPITEYGATEENYQMPSLSIYHGDVKANEQPFMKYEFNEDNQMPSLTIYHGDAKTNIEEPFIKDDAKEENSQMPSLSIYHSDAKTNIEKPFIKYDAKEKDFDPSATIYHG
ncbi:hypothetical protein Syun_015700 [Stephania yunnanensis]|uniref:Uncharacterized protein n=1 Tax=Stephania yunnanensis TaxID=152371 RepID=A0AAP0JMH8_9MAGN